MIGGKDYLQSVWCKCGRGQDKSKKKLLVELVFNNKLKMIRDVLSYLLSSYKNRQGNLKMMGFLFGNYNMWNQKMWSFFSFIPCPFSWWSREIRWYIGWL